MKRSAKKLTLSRETLRRLEEGELKDVGGATFATNNNYTCGCQTGTNCDISLCICQ